MNSNEVPPIEIPELADSILRNHSFAQDKAGRLFVYQDGVYLPNGERVIEREVKCLLEKMQKSNEWSSHKSGEVVKYICVDSPELWERPPLYTINLRNGLLDVETRTLRAHSPEWLSVVQLPVSYNPKANCTAWEKYIVPCFPDDAPATPYELAAWLMTPDTSIQKAALLIGEGSNGKSTFLNALIAFIGRSFVSALSLQKLEEDRFSVARLLGKLANICPDLPSTHLSETGTFKSLTGTEGAVTGEFKFVTSFEFQPFARLIFSANQPPRSNDATHAFFRRWIVYPFARTFESGTEQEPVSREWLDRQLSSDAELSGVLNRALSLLPQIRKQGLSETPQMKAAWEEFRQETDPLAVWLDRHTVEDPAALTPRQNLGIAYREDCVRRGQTPLTLTMFGRAFKRLRPAVQEAQRNHNGTPKTWVYVGIRLLTAEDGHSQGSLGSPGSSLYTP